eukprot:8575487-Ditylum_brightwellii.AAC.1
MDGNPAKKSSNNKRGKEEGIKKIEEEVKRDMLETMDSNKMDEDKINPRKGRLLISPRIQP